MMLPLMRFFAFALVLLLTSSSVFASGDFSAGNLSHLSQDDVNALIQPVLIATDHRAYAPASPLGLLLGIDVGLSISGAAMPSSFRNAMVSATQQPLDQIPSVLMVPQLDLRKGLPFGIDLGFSYFSYQSYYKTYAADVQYALVDESVIIPAMALRGSYSHEKLWFIEGHNFTFDFLISKDFVFIEPYFGAGLQFWSGDLSVPQGGTMGLPTGVSPNASGMNPHFFVGVPIKFFIFHLTPEFGYSTSKLMNYGVKFSVNL